MAGSRITCVENLYYQPKDGSAPTAVTSRYAVDLVEKGSPLFQTLDVTNSWLKLEGSGAVTLLIQVAPIKLQKMPTPEERTEMSGRKLIIGYDPNPKGARTQHSPPALPIIDLMTIGCGESCRFTPLDVGRLVIRSNGPTLSVTVFAVRR